MPKGPKGQKRPADVIGNAVKVMKIATGEECEELTEDGKDKAAQSLGRRGGRARAERTLLEIFVRIEALLDISKASKALADYKLRGGVTLEQLKKQLGLDKK